MLRFLQGIRVCLLAFLAVTILAQPLLAFSGAPGRHLSLHSGKQKPTSETSSSRLGMQYLFQADYAVELEEEEEESLAAVFHLIVCQGLLLSQEASWVDTLVRTRILQITYALQKKPVSPLFVLHHSWKDALL